MRALTERECAIDRYLRSPIGSNEARSALSSIAGTKSDPPPVSTVSRVARKGRHEFDDDDKQVIRDMYLKGVAVRVIARRVLSTASSVYYVLRQMDVICKRRQGYQFSTEDYVELHTKGMTVEQIAEKIGCSQSLVRARRTDAIKRGLVSKANGDCNVAAIGPV